jgi:hypothetical protein
MAPFFKAKNRRAHRLRLRPQQTCSIGSFYRVSRSLNQLRLHKQKAANEKSNEYKQSSEHDTHANFATTYKASDEIYESITDDIHQDSSKSLDHDTTELDDQFNLSELGHQDDVPQAELVDLDELDDSSQISTLSVVLGNALTPFLKRRTGGQLNDRATVTTVNRIGQFIGWSHRHLNNEWSHRNVHNDQPSLSALATSSRLLLQWFIKTIMDHPTILESYIEYQSNVLKRGPSTILNHMVALRHCHDFLVFDGKLDGSDASEPLLIDCNFSTRFSFFNTRCRRSLRKDLKQYK